MGRSPSDLVIFIGTRLLQLVPVLIGVIALTFIVTHLIVSDPCANILGHGAKGAALAECRAAGGYDLPVAAQFVHYISGLTAGNWGSYQGIAVLPAIAIALPATVELVFAALFLMIIIGIPLGVIASNRSGRWPDHLVRVVYLSGWAVPTFLGGLLIALFVMPLFGLSTGEFSQTPNFPQTTHMSILDALLAGNIGVAGDALLHLFFPALALAILNLGIITRLTRSSMLEILPLDFVKTARMKGLAEAWVLYKHALRNSLITTTTILGITAGGLLSGTVVIEEIFQWPGIGQYAFFSIIQHNLPGTIGVVIVFAIGVVIANLVADILYGVLDPRVNWR